MLVLLQGHICEIQIHLQAFIDIKHHGGHAVYKFARALHGYDTASARHSGAITLDVIRRVSMGLVWYVDASHSAIDGDAVEKFGEMLTDERSMLRELVFKEVKFGTTVESLLGAAPLACQSLQTLDLQGCELSGMLAEMYVQSYTFR